MGLAMSGTFGLLCLLVLVLLCLVGLWHPQYNDNLGHCIGMVLVGLWALAQALRIIRTGYTPPDDLWLYVGLLCFGGGTAVRTWLYKRKQR